MIAVLTDKQATETFAANVREVLALNGRTNYWLMKQLDCSPGSIYPILKGAAQPSIGMVARIAAILDVAVDDLLQPVQKKSRKAT